LGTPFQNTGISKVGAIVSTEVSVSQMISLFLIEFSLKSAPRLCFTLPQNPQKMNKLPILKALKESQAR